MSLLFLSLLPLLAIFHLVMWFGFTRTLFRPETGDLKRMGYLVGLEDRMRELRAGEKQTGQPVLGLSDVAEGQPVATVIFGDSFATSLAKACQAQSGESVVAVGMSWDSGNGLGQIESRLTDPWFRAHGVKTIVVERVEYAWLETFTEEEKPVETAPRPAPGRGLPSSQSAGDGAGGGSPAPALHPKAPHWTFANNGNFKVLLYNFGYLFSPTAFKMTNTCIVRLKRKFFTCSYGDKLLFYRGDFQGAETDRNRDRVEKALERLRELADFCRQQGFRFQMVVPPEKSYLYYDWVKHPFYHDSKLLETLQARATDSGYVDVKQVFHEKLAEGYQDLYYPDDLHWNYPAAEMAAAELGRAQDGP